MTLGGWAPCADRSLLIREGEGVGAGRGAGFKHGVGGAECVDGRKGTGVGWSGALR